MASTNKDEILSNFIGVTGCSQEEATSYLEAAQWNQQTAMDIFFDSSSDGTIKPASTNTLPPGTNIEQSTSCLLFY